jgi:carboxyl-terminal processing protease
LDRAVIVGKRSFGKGLVQRYKPLPYGSQLKVTISRYYTPSGRCIQALDYRNRKEDGTAVRIKEGEYSVFKTKRGRDVYDGGGINPDIVVGSKTPNKFIDNLFNSTLVFDFSNQYFYTHKLDRLEGFNLNNKDFEHFKKMSIDKKYNSKDIAQEGVEQLKKILTNEGLEPMATSFDALSVSLQDSKLKVIDQFKTDIMSVLENEIIKRYFYREGMYAYILSSNTEIFKAQDIINDVRAYQNILK